MVGLTTKKSSASLIIATLFASLAFTFLSTPLSAAAAAGPGFTGGKAEYTAVASSSDGTKLAAVSGVDSRGNMGSIYLSSDSGFSWTKQTSPGVANWTSITSSSDGTKLAAVSGFYTVDNPGSIWTSSDSGATWSKRTSAGYEDWTSIASSGNGSILMAGSYSDGADGYGTLLKSTDWGVTWTPRVPTPYGTWQSITASSDGTKIAAVSSNWGPGSIWTSTNSGVTWTERTSAGSEYWKSITSSSDGTKLAAVPNTDISSGPARILTSSDSGVTWTPRTLGPTAYWQSIASNGDGTQLAAVSFSDANGGLGNLWTSADSGLTWAEQTSAGSATWAAIASNIDGTKLVAVSKNLNGSIFTSVDSGSTWTERSQGKALWSSIASNGDGSKLAAVSGSDSSVGAVGSLVTSTDAGRNWTQRVSAGKADWKSITSNSDGTKLAAVSKLDASGNAGSIFTSTDSGVTWSERTSAGKANWWSIAASSDGTKLAAVSYTKSNGSFGSIWTSANSGATWQERTSAGNAGWFSITSNSDGTKLAAVSAVSSDLSSGGVYTSSDSGATWTKRSSAGSAKWQSIASSGDGTKLVAVSSGDAADNPGSIFASTDSGSTWNKLAAAGTARWASITSNLDGTMLAAVSTFDSNNNPGGIYTSINSGATWTEKTSAGQAHWAAVASSGDGTKIAAVPGADGNGGLGSIFTFAYSGPRLDWFTPTIPKTYVGATSAVRTEIITNPGDLDLVFGSGAVSLAGADAVDFSIVDDSCSNKRVAPAGSCTVGFTFTPTAVGLRSANLVLASNLDLSPSSVKLVAKGAIRPAFSGSTWTQRADAGKAHWQSIASNSEGTKLAAVSQFDSNGNPGSIFTSSNSGVTWTERTSAGKASWWAIASNSQGTKLAAVSYSNSTGEPGAIFTSADSGESWTERTSAGNAFWSSIASNSDGTKLVAVSHVDANFNAGSIWISNDSGQTWTKKSSAGNASWWSVASSADGSKLVAASRFDSNLGSRGPGSIWTSVDSGENWTKRTSAGNNLWQDVASNSDGTKLVAVSNDPDSSSNIGSIYASSDSGATWNQQTSAGANIWQSITSSSDGTKLAAVTYAENIASAGSIFTSDDSGFTWNEQTSAGNAYWTAVTSNSDGTRLVAASWADATNDFAGNIFTTQLTTITAVSPSEGRPAGGTLVTVTGTGFFVGATVTVGGESCTSPTVVSDTTLTCFTPAGTLGASDVRVFNLDSTHATAFEMFTYTQALVSTSTPAIPNTFTGMTSSLQTETITNIGDADLVFGSGAVTKTGANAADFSIVADNCSDKTIAPTGTCAVTYTFTPGGVGTRTADLVFTSNATGSPHSVTLSATGVGRPTFAASTPAIPNTFTGTTSALQTETITNTGDADLVFGAGAVTKDGANAPDFTIVADNCSDQTIAPAGNCTVTYTFTPGGVGTRTADLIFTSNATGSPDSVSLTATGVGRPTFAASTPAIPNTFTGMTSSLQSETTTNIGDADLVFGSGAVNKTGTHAADFTIVSDNCSNKTIAPAGTCTVTYTFTPGGVGSRTTNLVFTSNATASPHSVTLSATGVGRPTFAASTPAIPNTFTGMTSSLQTETITNTGDADLVFGAGAVNTTGAHAADFTIVTDRCSNKTIAPNGTCTVTYTFTPRGVGSRTTNLVFTSNATGSPRNVALSATGVGRPTFAASTPAIPNTFTGMTSSLQTETITNIGDSDLVFGAGAVTKTGANAADFTMVADNCSGRSVAPAGTCTVTYTFAPGGVGTRTANLVFTSNATGSPQSVALNATGVAQIVPVPPVTLTAVAATGSKVLITVKNAKGKTIKIEISGNKTVSKTATSNSYSIKITAKKGTRKVTLTVGTKKLFKTLKVK